MTAQLHVVNVEPELSSSFEAIVRPRQAADTFTHMGTMNGMIHIS